MAATPTPRPPLPVGRVVTARGDRVSLLHASARTLEATGALVRSEAALVRRHVEHWLGGFALRLALAIGGGLLLAAAWVLAVVATVMAFDTVALPLRLAAVAAVHAAAGGAFLLGRRRIARASHG